MHIRSVVPHEVAEKVVELLLTIDINSNGTLANIAVLFRKEMTALVALVFR